MATMMFVGSWAGAVSAADDSENVLTAVLEKAALKVVWQTQFPRQKGEVFERFFVHSGNIYALTKDNILLAVDAAEGTFKWSSKLATSEPFCSEPFYYQGKMLFVLGQRIVEVLEQDGRILMKMDVDFSPSTNAVRNDELLFVGCLEKRLYAIRLADKVRIWQSVFSTQPLGRLAILDDKVYVGCEDGSFYVSRTETRELVWKLDTAGQLTGAVIAGDECYVPSMDTALYCLDAGSGKALRPKYRAGGSLAVLPIVTETAIYQPIEHKSLLCLNRNDGTVRWELNDGESFLAEGKDITYCVSLDNEVVLMSNVTGKKVLAFQVPGVTLYAPNSESSRVYLGTVGGNVICLEQKK